MNLNQAGIDLVKEFEGCKLTAYPDPGTGGAPYTIGYGTTGPGILQDTVWTQEEADRQLTSRLESTASFVRHQLMVNLTDNQFSACVCLAYNIGIGHFAHSSLLTAINHSDFETAAKEFLRWDTAGGKVMEGLERRRKAEQALFLET